MLGYSRDELLSLGVVDIDPEFPPDKWRAHWEDMKRKKFMSLTTQHKTSDGGTRIVDMEIHHYKFEDEEFIVGTARDITEKQKAQQRFAELAASNQAMIDLLSESDGVWDWKVGTDDAKYAPGLRKILGFEGDDRVGFPDTLEAFTSRVHPDDMASLWKAVGASLTSAGRGEPKPFVHEFRLRNKQANTFGFATEPCPASMPTENRCVLVGVDL